MRFFLTLLLLLFCAISLFPLDPGTFSLSLVPGGDIPFPVTINGIPGAYYTFGGGATVSGDYVFPFAPVLFGGAALSGIFAPSNEEFTNLNSIFAFLSFSARAGLQVELIPDFTLEVSGKGGWSLVMNEGRIGNGPYFGADTGFSVQFNETFGLGISASYDNYWSLSQQGPQYHALSIRLGARFAFGGSGSNLEMKDIKFLPVFPAFYGVYDKNPLGEIRIKNGEKDVIRDVKVSFFIRQYMDAPTVCAVVREMAPNEELTFPLLALFTDKILGISEDADVRAEISAEYRFKDEAKSRVFSRDLEIRNRNAMSWDDERKAASFVTPGDPPVLEYARAVASAVRAAGGGDVNENLRIAMGLFQSLELSGLTYARDPSTPYEDAVKNKAAIDRLRFPGQTLVDKAGDRDELSILYSALLEAAGIETAFVTVPGRIFIAFSAGLEPDDAKDSFSTTGDLIFLEGKTWVPVEITTIGEGFLAAWKTGAGEWRDSSRDSAARFHPVHAAWTVYPPAGLVSSGAAGAPNNDAVTGAYSRELAKFVNREIAAVEGKLKDEVLRSRNDPGPANRLGVLYARYGLYEKAAAEFEKIVAGREFIPAIVNLGNIHYVKKEWKEALAMYGRAYMENKNEATVILSIAKVMYEMKDLQAAEEYYSVLETKDRFLARKYSYIVTEATDDEGRAAVNELAARAVWME